MALRGHCTAVSLPGTSGAGRDSSHSRKAQPHSAWSRGSGQACVCPHLSGLLLWGHPGPEERACLQRVMAECGPWASEHFLNLQETEFPSPSPSRGWISHTEEGGLCPRLRLGGVSPLCGHTGPLRASSVPVGGRHVEGLLSGVGSRAPFRGDGTLQPGIQGREGLIPQKWRGADRTGDPSQHGDALRGAAL